MPSDRYGSCLIKCRVFCCKLYRHPDVSDHESGNQSRSASRSAKIAVDVDVSPLPLRGFSADRNQILLAITLLVDSGAQVDAIVDRNRRSKN